MMRRDCVHGCTYAAETQAQGRAQVEQRRSSCRGVESGHLNNGYYTWDRWFSYAT
jgi:hypothetical protein